MRDHRVEASGRLEPPCRGDALQYQPDVEASGGRRLEQRELLTAPYAHIALLRRQLDVASECPQLGNQAIVDWPEIRLCARELRRHERVRISRAGVRLERFERHEVGVSMGQIVGRLEIVDESLVLRLAPASGDCQPLVERLAGLCLQALDHAASRLVHVCHAALLVGRSLALARQRCNARRQTKSRPSAPAKHARRRTKSRRSAWREGGYDSPSSPSPLRDRMRTCTPWRHGTDSAGGG